MAVSGRNRRNIKKMNLVIGFWNVCTLQDSGTGPERITAVIAKILSKYKIDIVAISETLLADESQRGIQTYLLSEICGRFIRDF